MRSLDYEIMAHAFAAHRELGRLCDERIYQEDLAMRLATAGIEAVREAPIQIAFRDFTTTREIDLIVYASAIYELKTAAQLTASHEAQLLNYLLLTGGTRGKLVNFRSPAVESRFVNTTLDRTERHASCVDAERWAGPPDLANIVQEILADWGTSLETALYQEALVHFCGGEKQAVQQLPLRRGTQEIGPQRFHLWASQEAFNVTCLEPEMMPAYESQLHRLIRFSPLRSFHWINIGRRSLHLTTLSPTH